MHPSARGQEFEVVPCDDAAGECDVHGDLSLQPTVDNPRRVRVRLRSVSGDIGIDRVDP